MDLFSGVFVRLSPFLLSTLLLAAACKDKPVQNGSYAASLNVDPSTMSENGGVKYKDLVVGTGPAVAQGQPVAIHYVGKLTNGTQFDANGPNDQPYVFRLGMGEVIPGFDTGIAGMKVGGRRQVIIPPELAYGASGSGPVPPNATLVFVIDVVGVQ
jgi:peptidylprolyl isomerase